MAKIYYHAVPADWRKEQKYKFLEEHESVSKIDWTEITPDAKQNWLTAGMAKEFDGFVSIGNKEAKASKKQEIESIFKTFSNGVKTNRDTWTYNFQKDELSNNIQKTIGFFEEHRARWNMPDNQMRVKRLRDAEATLEQIIDEFVTNDDSKISWSGGLKAGITREDGLKFDADKIRNSIFRPFQLTNLYFDRGLNERVYLMPSIFPTAAAENENLVICVPSAGMRTDYWCFVSSFLPNLTLTSLDGNQCFGFYTYNEDGTNRRENITDWVLDQFREQYGPPVQKPARSKGIANEEESPYSVRASATDAVISKWDIFYYTYAILHHPEYRKKYAANLKRELPRIPFAPDFWSYAQAGKALADIHVNYEDQPEYTLEMIESGKLALDWRVEKMRYNKDKTAIIYNDFLTIGGIPPEIHEYRLGNRSALDWIVDQYKVSIDKRSGITNDPNRDDDPQYIVRLIKKIAGVSLKTNEIVNSLPGIVKS